jgi:hypothetical protein
MIQLARQNIQKRVQQEEQRAMHGNQRQERFSEYISVQEPRPRGTENQENIPPVDSLQDPFTVTVRNTDAIVTSWVSEACPKPRKLSLGERQNILASKHEILPRGTENQENIPPVDSVQDPSTVTIRNTDATVASWVSEACQNPRKLSLGERQNILASKLEILPPCGGVEWVVKRKSVKSNV